MGTVEEVTDIINQIGEKCMAAGMEYYIVEQDRIFDGQEPLEVLKISYNNLKKIGFR